MTQRRETPEAAYELREGVLWELMDGPNGYRWRPIGEIRTLLAATAASASVIASDQPNDATGQERLLLNAYGRACYDAGRASASASVIAEMEQLITTWRREADEAEVKWPRGSILPNKKLRKCADALSGLLRRETPATEIAQLEHAPTNATGRAR